MKRKTLKEEVEIGLRKIEGGIKNLKSAEEKLHKYPFSKLEGDLLAYSSEMKILIDILKKDLSKYEEGRNYL